MDGPEEPLTSHYLVRLLGVRNSAPAAADFAVLLLLGLRNTLFAAVAVFALVFCPAISLTSVH